MKKNLIYVLTFFAVATALFLKANLGTQRYMSDIALANVEALASSEININEYVCYGEGKVVCPYSGQMVAGYYKKRNLE